MKKEKQRPITVKLRGDGYDTHELAWAAGFFDGEGWLSFRPNLKGRERGGNLRLAISQTDYGILERFRQAVGGHGRIEGPRLRGTNKPIWQFVVDRYELVRAIVATLWRWLSNPKRDQIQRNFQRHHQVRVRDGWHPQMQRQAFCRRGHALTPENTYTRPSNGDRYCRMCKKQRRWSRSQGI